MTRAWEPLLEGERAARANAAVDEIAADLVGARESFDAGDSRWLGAAPTELALFFAYLAAATTNDAHARTAEAFLETAAAHLDREELLHLFGGLAGVGWVLQHLQRPPVDLGVDATDVLDPIDDIVLRQLAQTPWTSHYDLVGGLVGFGVYLLSRLPDPRAEDGVRRVIAHLADLAEPLEGGLAWPTPPRLLSPTDREAAPRGFYNVGVAHGTPGIIGLLAQVHARGLERHTTQRLLDGAVPWVLAQQLPPGSATRLPRWVSPGVVAGPSRVAWCYGDLGVALVVLNAARVVGRPAWEQAAITLGRGMAERALVTSITPDACLCHGWAGNAHLFARLHQASGAAIFRDAAVRCYASALDARGAGDPVGGYTFWVSAGPGRGQHWQPHAGLLGGLVGLGLTLLAASRPLAPAWDEVLLVCPPPSAAAAPPARG